jgi:hypothetical protein
MHGPLDSFSGFPFENYLGQLKRLLRKPYLPLSQVVRRLSEVHSSKNDSLSTAADVFKKRHLEGPVPAAFETCDAQYKEVFFRNICIKTSVGNNCIAVDGRVAVVRNILIHGNNKYIVIDEFLNQQSFFNHPLSSTDIGIFEVSCLSNRLKCIELTANVQKCVLFPSEDAFVSIPLLHSVASG